MVKKLRVGEFEWEVTCLGGRANSEFVLTKK